MAVLGPDPAHMISIQTEKCESVSSSATYIIQSVQQIVIKKSGEVIFINYNPDRYQMMFQMMFQMMI